MATIRFGSGGTREYKDHRQLDNIGTREHDEIDLYLDELDDARGTHTSVGGRLDDIEQTNTEQSSLISDIQDEQVEHDNKIGLVETEVTEAKNEVANFRTELEEVKEDVDGVIQDIGDINQEVSKIPIIESNVTKLFQQSAKNTYDIGDLDTRVRAVEQGGNTSQEVIDARTDKNGVVYGSLKARLDATQGTTDGDGSGGGYLNDIDITSIEISSPTNVVTIPQGYEDFNFILRNGQFILEAVDYSKVGTEVVFNEDLSRSEIITFVVLGVSEVDVLGLRDRVAELEDKVGEGGTGDVSLNQVTKLSIVAPREIRIPITTEDFKFIPIEVLKFKVGEEDVIKSIINFSNSDGSDFEDSDWVKFDDEGMSLVTEEVIVMEEKYAIEGGYVLSTEIDLDRYKHIEEVRELIT